MRILSPQDVINSRAPKVVAGFVSSFLNLISWITLPVAFVSMFSDVRLVVKGMIWLFKHAGVLKAAMADTGLFLLRVVKAWRSFSAPAIDWLQSIIHVHFAPPAWDFFIIAFLLASRLLAATWVERAGAKRAVGSLSMEDRRLLKEALVQSFNEPRAKGPMPQSPYKNAGLFGSIVQKYTWTARSIRFQFATTLFLGSVWMIFSVWDYFHPR